MSSNYRKSGNEVSLFRPPKAAIPLAERVRPKKLTDVIGQEHLLGKSGVISEMVKSGNLSAMGKQLYQDFLQMRLKQGLYK